MHQGLVKGNIDSPSKAQMHLCLLGIDSVQWAWARTGWQLSQQVWTPIEQERKSKSRVQDAAVQDRCSNTVLANDGPTADDLTVIRFEVVVAQVAAVQVYDGEKMAMEAVVAAARLVQDMKEMVIEEMVMEAVQVQLHKGQC